jgi:hypothetical protein
MLPLNSISYRQVPSLILELPNPCLFSDPDSPTFVPRFIKVHQQRLGVPDPGGGASTESPTPQLHQTWSTGAAHGLESQLVINRAVKNIYGPRPRLPTKMSPTRLQILRSFRPLLRRPLPPQRVLPFPRHARIRPTRFLSTASGKLTPSPALELP